MADSRPWLHRQARFQPYFPATNQGVSLFPTGLSELLHHTGAGGFVISSTIGDQPQLRIKVQFPCSFRNVVGGHPDRPFGLCAASLKAALRPHV